MTMLFQLLFLNLWQHRMDHLRILSLRAVTTSVHQLSPSGLVQDACGISASRSGPHMKTIIQLLTHRYPALRSILVERLPSALSKNSGAVAFKKKLSAYFHGELPHCKEVITSTLMCLQDEVTIHTKCYELAGGYNSIQRVSCPWPDRTREPLRVSLHNGIFDDFQIAPDLATTMHPVYLSTTVTDEGVYSSFWRCASLNSHARTR